MSKSNYTKHYYAGEERITSKIDTSVLAHLNDSIYLNTPNTPTKQSLTTTGYVNAWLCLGTLKPILCESKAQEPAGNSNSSNPEEGADAGEASAREPSTGNSPGIVRPSCLSLIILRTFASSPANAPTTATYFYHPDHLSSSLWITDQTGYAIQHLQYLPFGELRVDQHTTSWNSRYTFSAKEKDEESGYGYFGARYYDSDLSIWLSVDPMSDKYPSLSPYAYVANNPVKLVDPNGKEVIIGGDQAESAHNSISKMTNLKVELQEGKLTIVGGEIKNKYDQQVADAINDPSITVNINASVNNGTAGSYMGTNYDPNSQIASSTNNVNMTMMTQLETKSKAPEGSGILHEITEGYALGKKSIEIGRDIGRAERTEETNIVGGGRNTREITTSLPASPDYYLYKDLHDNVATPEPRIWRAIQRMEQRQAKKQGK
jgi:RHS repeat-associated protein